MKILIVLPAFNEEHILERSLNAVIAFCKEQLQIEWQVVIADNKSTDNTAQVAGKIASQEPNVEYLFVDKQGKGAAIRAGWQAYKADIYCFMDADLATDLSALPRLIAEFGNGYDVVVGSRYHSQSVVQRSMLRKFFSFGYRLVLRILLGVKTKDVPCGFKAINSKVKQDVLSRVQDNQWFFDSELIILAHHGNFKIKEIPVQWHDPREGYDKTRVKPVSLALAYFGQAWSIRKRLKKYV